MLAAIVGHELASDASGRHVGAPWRLLEALLGLVGKHLGAIWEASGRHLGAPWRLLEAALGLRGSKCIKERKSCILLS